MLAVDETFPDAQGETLDRMDAATRYNAWLVERARPYLGRRVIDVGAGTGTFSAGLAEICDEVVALEPDPALLPRLRERTDGLPQVRIVEDTIENVAALGADGGFATAVCFNVLEHVRDDEAALAVIAQLLKPQGALLLLVPAHELLFGAIDTALAHERRYSRSALGTLLDRNGYDVAELRYVNPVGAIGWLVTSRVLRRAQIPKWPLAALDRAVPLLRPLDALRLPFGLSLWAVARRR